MKYMIFEETEYTVTLNHMIDRYKRNIIAKNPPMQKKLKEYRMLSEKERKNQEYRDQ